jgi:DNA-binding NarL/FixJ family response regulator
LKISAQASRAFIRPETILRRNARSLTKHVAHRGRAAGVRTPDDGLPNKLIAYEIGVAEATVKAHVSAMLSKLS